MNEQIRIHGDLSSIIQPMMSQVGGVEIMLANFYLGIRTSWFAGHTNDIHTDKYPLSCKKANLVTEHLLISLGPMPFIFLGFIFILTFAFLYACWPTATSQQE